ncbi:MAG: hypothetical protein ABIH28_00450 [archaeon]
MKIKLFFTIAFCMILLSHSVLAITDIGIDLSINPSGVISKDYNVVGDLFTYNLTLFNNNSETFNDTLTIKIMAPDNKSIAFGDETNYIFSGSGVQIIRSPLQHFISIPSGSYESLIPYINLSENKDTKIWPFDVAGDYSMEICSSDFNTKFVRTFNSPYGKTYYYYYHCINYYFSVMPEWQYKLFNEEKAAAEKTKEANQKLLDLNLQVENATQIIKNATIMMLIVAIITLYVATTEEKDRKGKLFKIIKTIAKISIVLLILYLIYLIMIFSGVVIVA